MPSANTPFVFVHGVPSDSRVWRHLFARAPLGARLVAFDLPDHGAASPAPEATLADLEAAVIATVESAGAPVTLVGHSFGAYLVARVLPRLGERVARAVLLAGMPSVPATGGLFAALEPEAQTREALLAQLLGPDVPAGPHAALLEATVFGLAPEQQARLRERLGAATAPEAAVAPYETPALVVHATGDATVPFEHGIELAKRGRHAELLLLEGASHFLPLTHVDALANLLFRPRPVHG